MTSITMCQANEAVATASRVTKSTPNKLSPPYAYIAGIEKNGGGHLPARYMSAYAN